MAFSKARRLSDFIAADGTIPTGKFASGTITSAHIANLGITHADLHTNMDLTGKTVLVANASTGDNDTTAANTAFVQQEIAALVDSSPSALNTLNELAAALGDDANFSTTVNTNIAAKLPLAGGTMTGHLRGTSFSVGAGDAGEALNILDGGHTGQGAANTVSLASFAESASGNSAGLWIGSMTNENTAVLGSRTSSGNFAFQTYHNSAWGERMRISSGGNVGIGTDSPAQLLNIESTGTAKLRYAYSSAIYGEIGRKSNGVHEWAAYENGAALTFGTSGTNGATTERMRINSSGNVGIGTLANIDQMLHLEKSAGTTIVKTEVAANSIVGFEIQKTGSTTSNWRIVDGQTANGNLEIYDVTDSRSVMMIDGDGDIGMGVAPATHAKLTLGGTATSYSSVLAFDNNTAGGATFFMVASDNTWSAGANKFLMGHGVPSSSAVDVTIDADGRVAIGTDTPSAHTPLTAYYSATSQFNIGGPQSGISNNVYYNGSAYTNRNTGAGGSLLQMATDGSFAFRRATSGSSPTLNYSMYIDANGAVGIGPTSITSGVKLEVTGGKIYVPGHNIQAQTALMGGYTNYKWKEQPSNNAASAPTNNRSAAFIGSNNSSVGIVIQRDSIGNTFPDFAITENGYVYANSNITMQNGGNDAADYRSGAPGYVNWGSKIENHGWKNWSGTGNYTARLYTPIVHNEGNMFQLEIDVFGYSTGGAAQRYIGGGYAYSGSSLIAHGTVALSGSLTHRLTTATHPNFSSTVVVFDIGYSNNNGTAYYNHMRWRYQGWNGKKSEDFVWAAVTT